MTPEAHARKMQWQRENRRKFVVENGYSSASHYATGGNREAVLGRDGYRCVRCGMTDEEHKVKWDRPITIDHKSKDRSDNSMENLQTLCLTCHGKKDLIPRLRAQRVPNFKVRIISMRTAGATYQQIADELGFSLTAIWKWCGIWDKEKS